MEPGGGCRPCPAGVCGSGAGTANPSFWDSNLYYSANGSPNTTDEWVEASYLPWWNTRLSVRYTVFNKFRGLTGNNGVSPSKFNTIELLAWIAY